MFTRRIVMAGLTASTLPLVSGCGGGDGSSKVDLMKPGQARLLIRDGMAPVSEVSGHYNGRDFSLDSPFRVASISKVLVGELARRLHKAGALDMDADAGEIIGFPLRHPEFPYTPITLKNLIAHQSGIADPAVYWMAAPGNIRTLLTDDIWEAGVKPGEGFRYANLNYGIAATVMEAATGERFDHLFTEMIAKPLGLDVGFNWSGVSAEKRAKGFPCLRWVDEAWAVQIDGAETLQSSEPAILKEDGFNLDSYVPGTNGTLFSPQGGLRASVNDLAVIGRGNLAHPAGPRYAALAGDIADGPGIALGRNRRPSV